ncbi:MAG: T9SS type A sorting domain-containing protein [Bacteroidia bacterium]
MKHFFLLIVNFILLNSIYGQSWSAVGSGVDGRVSSFAIFNGDLYVGGEFNNPGGVTPFGLLKWDGVTFDTLPGTYLLGSCRIEAMTVYNNELYVGGSFCTNCSSTYSIYNNIAKWDGTSWDSVGRGFDNVVYSLAVYNDSLYAGGDMGMSGTRSVNNIAKWNGSQWLPVPNTIGGRVSELEVYKNELYVAGDFDYGTIGSGSIAKWNDTSWSAVGTGGINGAVYSLGTYNNELYAGGPYFTSAGGVSVNEIAKWNGTTWASVGTGIGYDAGDLFALKEYHGSLYSGGDFNIMDGNNIKSIAEYDGSTWNSVGSGVDSTNIVRDTMYVGFGDTTLVYAPHTIEAIQEFNNDLYVGGTFNMIGGTTAHSIAKWTTPLGIRENFASNSIGICPNPATNQITIKFDLTETKNTSIEIKNILGQTIKAITNMGLSKGTNKIEIDVSGFTNGIYFLQLQNGNQITNQKFIKE